MTKLIDKFQNGQRYRSRFNGDSFVVYDVFKRDGLIRVVWDSNKNYIADVWSHDIRPLGLVRAARPKRRGRK